MKNILLIDDDEINTNAFAARLERRGYKATLLLDGTNVLQHLETNSYDLVLLDIIMPTIDGTEVLKLIRSKYDKNQLPVIMITSIDDTADLSDAFKNGANDYLTKPVNVDAAVARIGAHLNGAELHKENLRKKQIEAIHAMVITYNHEINNPLAVAFTSLDLLVAKSPDADKKEVDRIRTALERIKEIVIKIKEASQKSEVNYVEYMAGNNMVKLK